MKRFLLALAVLASCFAGPALAQPSPVQIVGKAADGYDRQILATADGKLQVDSAAVSTPSATAANATTPVATSAAAGSRIVKASPGNLYGLNVVSGASAGFVLLFNSTTVPADGAVTPVKCMPLAANTGIDINMRDMPSYFSTGIVAVFSTTGCFAKTISATAFISGDAK